MDVHHKITSFPNFLKSMSFQNFAKQNCKKYLESLISIFKTSNSKKTHRFSKYTIQFTPKMLYLRGFCGFITHIIDINETIFQ